mgnify:CR=1 FL=1
MEGSKKLVGAGVAAAVLGVAVAYQMGAFSGASYGPDSEVPSAEEARAPAETATARAEPVTRYFSAVGTVTARERSRIAPRIRGTVVEVRVRAGDRVERGDLLVRLEAETTEAKVGQAQQQLEAARAERERAEQDLERFEALFEKDAATERRLEQVRAAYRSALAAERRAREGLNEAETVRSRTVLRAPSDGQVVNRLVDPGDLALPGKPVVVLQTPGSLRLSAFVREGLAMRVDLGDELRAEVPAADFEGQAPVEEVVPSVDPKSRAFEVKVSLPDAEALMPGMFGRVFIPEGRDEGVFVPPEAVRRVGQLELVRARTKDGRWALRHVTTGRRRGDRVEVLSGLAGGEVVALGTIADETAGEGASP